MEINFGGMVFTFKCLSQGVSGCKIFTSIENATEVDNTDITNAKADFDRKLNILVNGRIIEL
jgi:hypothetical protein